MSQKTLLTELIEELEKAITVARKMEESGKQPAVEVAILLDKLQRCYEMVLFSDGTAPHVSQETHVENRHTFVPEPKKNVFPDEPIKAKSTPVPEPRKPLDVVYNEPKAAVSSIYATKEIPKRIPSETKTPPKVKDDGQKSTKKPEILGDKLLAGKRFLSDFMAETKNRQDLSSKLQTKPIKDLSKAFGINDKFQYTRELFNNDSTHFQNTIHTLNEMGSIEEALIYIGAHFDWQPDEPTVIQFIDILQRRFL